MTISFEDLKASKNWPRSCQNFDSWLWPLLSIYHNMEVRLTTVCTYIVWEQYKSTSTYSNQPTSQIFIYSLYSPLV